MKKSFLKIVGALVLGFVMLYNIQISKTSSDNITLSSVSNTANAQSEDPYTNACNSWCYHQGYVCWLVLSTGADLYCYGWDEPF